MSAQGGHPHPSQVPSLFADLLFPDGWASADAVRWANPRQKEREGGFFPWDLDPGQPRRDLQDCPRGMGTLIWFKPALEAYAFSAAWVRRGRGLTRKSKRPHRWGGGVRSR